MLKEINSLSTWIHTNLLEITTSGFKRKYLYIQKMYIQNLCNELNARDVPLHSFFHCLCLF